jgi:DNA-binding NarL/FixJ family response regulator
MNALQRRLLLADDHPQVGNSLKALLEPEYEVLGIIANGAEVLDSVRRERPDALLLDLWMPGRNGLDLLTDLRRDFPEVRIVILTMHADLVVAVEAMHRGAQAYLLKDSGYAELEGALREVFEGKSYLSPRINVEPARTIFRDRGSY